MSDNGLTNWRSRKVGEGTKPASQFTPHPLNPRIHPQRQREAVAASLEEFGQIAPVVVNARNGYLVDGEERLWQALALGDDTPVDYVEVELSDEEHERLLRVFDATGELAEWDRDRLAQIMQNYPHEENAALKALNESVLARAISRNGETPPEDPGAQVDRAAEPQEKWQVQRGDLWAIGEHRLLCGDSTVAGDVEMVMDGERADAVVTDPPYGVDRNGIANDSPSTIDKLFNDVLSIMPITDAVVIAFQSPRMFIYWVDAIRDNEYNFERVFWYTDTGRNVYPWHGWMLRGEIIVVATIGKPLWAKAPPMERDTYSMNAAITSYGDLQKAHPTIKPVGLVKRIIQHTEGVIYDPFGGSGTTMVAAHQLGRRCRMIEISEAYCAVILERMSGMGLEPERV